MILYSDGRLITNELLPQENDEMEFILQERQLTTQQICSLLNTVEQTGFFDYDIAEYEDGVGLASYTWIEVNGQRSRQLYLHALGRPEADPALLDTYRLLANLVGIDRMSYQPERVAVWIQPLEGEQDFRDVMDDRGEWSLERLSLQELAGQAVPSEDPFNHRGGITVIEGENASALYDLFEGAPYPHTERIYSQNGQKYFVAVRALLPYETSGGQVGQSPVIPSPDLPIEPSQLTCSPADGLMEVP